MIGNSAGRIIHHGYCNFEILQRLDLRGLNVGVSANGVGMRYDRKGASPKRKGGRKCSCSSDYGNRNIEAARRWWGVSPR
jgi:hypothetical protein